MNTHVYRILTGAALAMFVGFAGAETYGNQPSAMPDKNASQRTQAPDSGSRLPANKGATENAPAQVEPAPQATDRMSGQGSEMNTAQGSKMSGTKTAKSTKSTHHAMTHHAKKAGSDHEQTAMPTDRLYRDALRNCAKEQDQNMRDKCLDSAIEQFNRNT